MVFVKASREGNLAKEPNDMSLDSNVVLRLVGMVIVRALDVRACLAWEREREEGSQKGL